MNRMNETNETRQFVSAVLEEDGRASMAQIRRRTDLTEGQLQHQFRKMEQHEFIIVERAKIPSQSGSRMKVAVIPEGVRDEAEALLSHDRKPERTTVDVVELADNVDEYVDFVRNTVYPELERLTTRVADLEAQLSEPQSTDESTPSEEDEGLAYARRIGLVEEGTDEPIR